MAHDRGIAAVTGVRIHAPAKINLGLAILGKRDDGYHEVDTIMAMVDLVDTITIRPVDMPGVSISGMEDVPLESNLMARAVRSWCKRTDQRVAYHVDIEKRIPSPAGLGGGSSNAAAVIRALDALHPHTLSAFELHHLAASLGADCPFFLGSTCARATGIGTDLKPLPTPSGWLVVVVPPHHLDEKTSTLYGSLTLQDYGSHDDLDAVEAALPKLDRGVMPNSFSRAALTSFPNLSVAASALTRTTGGWNLSGAGPAIYAVSDDQTMTSAWHEELKTVLPPEFGIYTAPFLTEPTQIGRLP